MKYSLLLCICVAAAFGCGHKDETVINGPNGETVKVSNDNSGAAHYSATDNKGNSVNETVDNGNVTYKATDDKGTTTQMTASNGSMTLSDSKGNSFNMSANAATEADLGVPFYPGSQPSNAGMNESAVENGVKTLVSTRTTKDSPSQVLDFYKGKVQDGKPTTMDVNGSKMATLSDGKLADGSDFNMTTTNDGKSDTTVTIIVKKPKSG